MCVRIFWVYAPKNFPIENFRVRSDLQKISIFHEFSCPFGKKNRWPAADSILMLPTFHIACLNRYTPNFSGVTQKLTWCQQFGLQIFPKWDYAHILPQKNAVFRCFFGQNKFSSKRSTFAYSMSYIFGKLWHLAIICSASYKASDFCWQNRLNFLEHLTMSRI